MVRSLNVKAFTDRAKITSIQKYGANYISGRVVKKSDGMYLKGVKIVGKGGTSGKHRY